MARISIFILTCLLFILCAFTSLRGQNEACEFTLTGQIIDEHDQSTLEYADIYIKELERGVHADGDGKFTIRNICAGTYTLLLRHVGCKPREEKLKINRNIKKNFFLEHHLLALEEITVLGEGETDASSLKESILEDQQIEEAAGKSLGASLNSITGVNMLQSGPTIAKPVIHGLHSNRILIMNNGVRQEGQQWGQEHAPEIDPFIADNFKVVKGANAIRYGADAIGGIVLVEPDELPNYHTLNGQFLLNSQSNNRQGVVAGKLTGGTENGFGWRAQGSIKRGGDASAADYRLSNTAISETNFSGTIGWRNDHEGMELYYSHFASDIAVLRSAHVGNLTDLTNAINSDVPFFVDKFTYTIDNPKQAISHDLVRVKGFKKFGEWDLSLQYGFQTNSREEFDRRRGANFSRPSLSLNIFTHTLDLHAEQKSEGPWKSQFGLSSLFQRNSNNAGTNANFLIPDYKNYGLGIFAIEEYMKENWQLELGIRYDFRRLNPLIFNSDDVLLTPNYDFNNVTLSVGGLFKVSEFVTLRTNIASAWRPPHVSELFSNGLHHGAAAIEQGLLYQDGELADLFSADIPSEQAIKAIATFEYKKDGLTIEWSGYHNTIDNYIYLRPDGLRLSIRGAFPVFQYVRTNARFIGSDALFAYDLNEKLRYKGQFSWIHATDVIEDDVLINIPANTFRNSMHYSTQGIFGSESSYVKIEAVTVLRQTRAPQAFLDFENQEPPSTIYDYKEAPDAYTLLNIHSGVEFKAIKVGFSIENLFNISYRDYMNRFRYFADDIGINYSFRLSYEF